jgi:uncharacterized CHY-type Zn-finger protein
MIKCKCVKCQCENTYENHKLAWMDGWDFVEDVVVCGDCSVMPTSNDTTNKDDDEK